MADGKYILSLSTNDIYQEYILFLLYPLFLKGYLKERIRIGVE